MDSTQMPDASARFSSQTSSESVHNRTADILSQDSLRYAPQSSYNSLGRFAIAPPSNEPYYATAMTEARLSHAEEIKNQIHVVDRTFQVQGIEREQ